MLLAIDTATRLISLALHDGHTVAAESTWVSDNYHTTELAPQAALLLRRAGLDIARLHGVAVAIGPGSYTGAFRRRHRGIVSFAISSISLPFISFKIIRSRAIRSVLKLITKRFFAGLG